MNFIDYVVIAVIILLFVVGYLALNYFDAKSLSKKREANLKLDNPDHETRCPKCASFQYYEVLKKMPFTGEIIPTDTAEYRCFDCNYTWKDE